VLCEHKTSFLFMVMSVYRPRCLTYQQKTGHGKMVFDMITPWWKWSYPCKRHEGIPQE